MSKKAKKPSYLLLHFIFTFQDINIKFMSQASTRNLCIPYQTFAAKGLTGLSKCIKKRKFVTKIFFLIMLNEVMKSCEK